MVRKVHLVSKECIYTHNWIAERPISKHGKDYEQQMIDDSATALEESKARKPTIVYVFKQTQADAVVAKTRCECVVSREGEYWKIEKRRTK